ncbi:MAG: amino acid adenylation domain-containing protein [Bacteroidota bacterium]
MYNSEKSFRETVNECLQIAGKYTREDLLGILFPKESTTDDKDQKINHTEYAQPLLFTIEYALAKLLMAWGVQPNYLIGHSLGEYVAACISGVFTLEDALRLVVKRGQLMGSAERGSMLSIKISEEELKPFLEATDGIDLAVINSVSSLVVAGQTVDIEEFQEQLIDSGYKAKRIRTSHAFHSFMMERILEAFEKEFAYVKMNHPAIPFISNITGRVAIFDEIRHPSYWSKHIRSTVRFADGADFLLNKGSAVFIEIGPGRGLCNFTEESEACGEDHHFVNLIRQPKQLVDDQKYLTSKLGKLWLQGVALDWEAYHQEEERKRLSLPTYAFEKTVYTADININQLLSNTTEPSSSKADAFIKVPYWRTSIQPNQAVELDKNQQRFLVFADKGNFSNTLVAALQAKGQDVFIVQAGPSFQAKSEQLFEINLGARKDYHELVEQLSDKGWMIDQVLHCATVDQEVSVVNEQDHADTLTEGYLGLSFLGQALAGQKQQMQLTVFTNHLAKVTRADRTEPLKATLLAPTRILPLEVNQLKAKLVDVQSPTPDQEAVEQLLNEIYYSSDESLVAYRYKERWIESFYALEEDERTHSEVAIQPGETYLLTGGFGGMGLTIASDLIRQYAAEVIVLHRSPFPPREVWDDWLEGHGEEERTSRKILRIRDAETSGGRLHFYQVDLQQEEKVTEVLTEVKVKHQDLKGIIWAAGVVDYGGIIQKRDREELLRYTASKIQALRQFEKIIDFASLDFISLFSSMGNVFYQNKFGQVAYNAANEFLEKYSAYAIAKYATHAFTINWCDWLNTGMAFNVIQRDTKAEEAATINAQIEHGIYPEEGLAIFYRCLQNKLPSCTIFKGSIQAERNRLRAKVREVKENANAPKVVLATDKAGKAGLEARIIEIFTQFFGKSNIRATDDFFELGGDSLKGMTLTERINKALGSKLTITDLYQHSTVAKLVAALSEESLEQSAQSSIPKASEKESYPLSSSQKRMYFLQQMDESSTVYNEAKAYWIKGAIDKVKLEDAFRQLIQRHESLRTVFHFEAGAARQSILDSFEFEIEQMACPPEGVTAAIRKFTRPFDLSKGPLLRIGLVEQSAEEHLLLINAHHIITDLTSLAILTREFMALYTGQSLPEIKLQYKDFADWQQSEAQQKQIEAQKTFWLEEFAEEPAVLELPYDFPRPKVKGHAGDLKHFEIRGQVYEKLRTISSEEGVSMYMLVLSLCNIFLSKLSSQEDIVIGSGIAGRQHADLEDVIGMFVGTLPMRNHPKGGLRFKEFLADLKSRSLAAFENQAYPYEELVDALNLERDSSRNPLFDVVLTYYNVESTTFEIPGLAVEAYQEAHDVSKFDLLFMIGESEDRLDIDFEYSTELFSRSTIERFAAFMQRIAAAIANNPDMKLSEIEIISAEEKRQILEVFNDTHVAYPSDASVVELFEEQVRREPHRIALVDGERSMTYKELNERSNQLARALLQEELQAEERVGIVADQSMEAIQAIMAVLKAGGTYLPLDPDYPQERLDHMIADSGIRLVLSEQKHLEKIDHHLQIIQLETAAKSAPVENLSLDIGADRLAYIMYTSGSTGNPKGVMVKHRNIVRLIVNNDFVPMNASTCILLTGALGFDATTFEIWACLLNGGALHLVSKDQVIDNEKLGDYLEQHQINTMWMTSALFDQHVQQNAKVFAPLHYLLIGGDKLNAGFVNAARAANPSIQIINGYGPTENTTFSATFAINQDYDDHIPIGRPIRNSTAYILDRFDNCQPIGVPGELCLGGDGVSRGYLNQDALTEAKFPKDPFRSGQRMYRSGDLAQWNPDGTIAFLGRKDNQVKIRGFRIELDEIERRLSEHNSILESLILVKEQQGDKFIVAYYVAADQIERKELAQHISDELPEYMVPSHFVHLSEMPLNNNGKRDRKALPEPEIQREENHQAPETASERQLAAIWSEVLKVEPSLIGMERNFFELGGHSIKAVHLINKVQEVFSVKIELRAIFEHTTLREQIQLIQQKGAGSQVALQKVNLSQTYFKTSHAQKRLYYLQYLDRESTTFNIAGSFHIIGALDVQRLKKAVTALIERHEALRTSFHLQDGSIVQRINEVSEPDFEVLDASDERSVKEVFNDFIKPFDLSTSSLLRCAVMQHQTEGNLLFLDLHHIICDGISLSILIRDFKQLYNGTPLSPVEFRYIDYVYWQEQLDLKAQKRFWEEQLAAPIPRLDLPVMNNREGIDTHPARRMMLRINSEQYRKIRERASAANASDFMFLLSIYYIFLSKLTGNTDIIVATDAIGRTHSDLKEVVGTFINALPLRQQLEEAQTFSEFLVSVRQNVLSAFDNQEYQFDQMISEIVQPDAKSGNPICNVHFSFSNAFEGMGELGEMNLQNYVIEKNETTEYEFKLEVHEENEQFDIYFIYSSILYEDEIMEVFMSYYFNVLMAALENDSVLLSDMELEVTADSF